jgi:hypothetical protein
LIALWSAGAGPRLPSSNVGRTPTEGYRPFNW